MFNPGDVVTIVASGVQGTVTGAYSDDTYYVKARGFEKRVKGVEIVKATGKIKIRVTQIKKGDRFWNEYWGKEVIATTDAYRLDGKLDPENYSETKPKPKVAVCEHVDGKWTHLWWMVEVGVGDGRGSGGGWSEVEHRYIEVERGVEAG